MSFKKFSAEHGAPSKDVPEVKPKNPPEIAQPALQPDQNPADVTPAPKT